MRVVSCAEVHVYWYHGVCDPLARFWDCAILGSAVDLRGVRMVKASDRRLEVIGHVSKWFEELPSHQNVDDFQC